MLKNDTLKNGTSRIGLYGVPPGTRIVLEIFQVKDRILFWSYQSLQKGDTRNVHQCEYIMKL